VIFRAPRDGVLRHVRLDAMTAIYDRRSGATHLVADVVPAILDALGQDDADVATLAARLETTEIAALAERLDELVTTGLIEAR
jgi:PqqD family protein of HPr-rel-A system